MVAVTAPCARDSNDEMFQDQLSDREPLFNKLEYIEQDVVIEERW
jgi:hypothetical protein